MQKHVEGSMHKRQFFLQPQRDLISIASYLVLRFPVSSISSPLHDRISTPQVHRHEVDVSTSGVHSFKCESFSRRRSFRVSFLVSRIRRRGFSKLRLAITKPHRLGSAEL